MRLQVVRTQEHRNTRAQEHKSTGTQEHRNTRAQEHKSISSKLEVRSQESRVRSRKA